MATLNDRAVLNAIFNPEEPTAEDSLDNQVAKDEGDVFIFLFIPIHTPAMNFHILAMNIPILAMNIPIPAMKIEWNETFEQVLMPF